MKKYIFNLWFHIYWFLRVFFFHRMPAPVFMGALTTGTTFVCESNPGGVKRIWIQAPLDFFLTREITFDYSAMSSAGANVFIEFKFKDGDAFWTDSFNTTDGGSQSWTNSLTIVANKRTQALRNTIMDLAACSACEGLIIIHQEMNDRVWIGGENVSQRYRLGSGTAAQTGQKLTDVNKETIVLVAETAEKINEFTGGVAGILV